MKYALFWSGGKDSLLALDRARRFGLGVHALANIYEGNTGRVRFHGVGKELIAAQAEALGLELLQGHTHPQNFEQSFQSLLGTLKARGFGGIVFGNIHLADIRAWYEERTKAHGFEHVEPLWGCAPESLLREFIERGHQARIVSVNLACGRREWLGRDFSEAFAAELERTAGVDVCGERGEYHSFAYGGPLFRKHIALEELAPPVTLDIENHVILDIQLARQTGIAQSA
ncbi:MAG TPA: diphthine--ammonia ligase [Candidatus Acidoferrales bacterium]|nr:diphthine--ammonia ligase [Candidatus Acidoferrales bacterium]